MSCLFLYLLAAWSFYVETLLMVLVTVDIVVTDTIKTLTISTFFFYLTETKILKIVLCKYT